MTEKLKGLELAMKTANENGGKCLSKEYFNAKDKLVWECSQGHIWESTFLNVYYNKSWCSECKKKKKKDLDFAINLAKSKGGKCLSKGYVNNSTPLQWECSQGHIWSSPLVNLTSKNSWCPECSYAERGILKTERCVEKLISLIEFKKGKILVQSKEKLKIECEFGHTWETKGSSILNGRWCPKCADLVRGKSSSLEIKDLHRDASVYGGSCLSTSYLGVNETYKWKCSEGHVWSSKYANIRSGSWCPKCKTVGKREEFCRQIFEGIFKKKFPNTRPDWIKSPIGRNLELDGYCEELNLAFEHNGIQHYEEGIFKKKSNLDKQKWYDEIKIEKCREKGVNLFVIPYWISTFDLIDFIESGLKNLNIPYKPLPKDFKYLPGKKRKRTKKNGKESKTSNRRSVERDRYEPGGEDPDPLGFLDSSIILT